MGLDRLRILLNVGLLARDQVELVLQLVALQLGLGALLRSSMAVTHERKYCGGLAQTFSLVAALLEAPSYVTQLLPDGAGGLR